MPVTKLSAILLYLLRILEIAKHRLSRILEIIMAITNIMNLQRISGTGEGEIQPTEIVVGFEVYGPAVTAGVWRYKCEYRDSEKAIFKCLDPEWKGHTWDLVIEFDAPDFSDEDMFALSDALKAFDSMSKTPSAEDRALVISAEKYGLAVLRSFTQAHWTERGIERIRALRA